MAPATTGTISSIVVLLTARVVLVTKMTVAVTKMAVTISYNAEVFISPIRRSLQNIDV